jgi:hypothetical protein
MFDPSLSDLIAFEPYNSAVNEYSADTKSNWSKGKYWLGGQIQMNLDDKITDVLITRVQQMFVGSDEFACNSFEMASIRNSLNKFIQIQEVIQRYREDAKNVLQSSSCE